MVSTTYPARFSLNILSPQEVASSIAKDIKLAKVQADCVALTTELDEANNLLMVSDDKVEVLAEAVRVLQDWKDKKLAEGTKTTKKKSPPKVKELGANLSKEKVLQEAGELAPFRDGGCRCRTWGERFGSQCGNKAKDQGMCLMHGKKVTAQGSWQLGFYDEHRPEVWAEDFATKNVIACPKHEKSGSKINWAMTPEVYDQAFGVVQVEEEDTASTIGFEEDEEEEREAVIAEAEDLEIDDNGDLVEEEAEHIPAEAGTRHTLPNGTILEANGLGGVAVVEVPVAPAEGPIWEGDACFECKEASGTIQHPDAVSKCVCQDCWDDCYAESEEDENEEY